MNAIRNAQFELLCSGYAQNQPLSPLTLYFRLHGSQQFYERVPHVRTLS